MTAIGHLAALLTLELVAGRAGRRGLHRCRGQEHVTSLIRAGWADIACPDEIDSAGQPPDPAALMPSVPSRT